MNSGPLNKYYESVLLLVILITGAWLRFHNLGEISFSNDEMSAITRARFETFDELVEKGIKVDGHPALVQTMMWLTIQNINDDVFTIRFPFAVTGIVSIFLIFLLAKRWFGSATGLLAAAALATLEFPLLYSQTARPYSIGLMFSLALAYFWTRLLFDERKSKWVMAGYVVACAGCIFTHYFSFMLAGIIGVSGLFFLRKENILQYLVISIIPLLLFLPSLPIFRQQFGYEGIGGWLSPPDNKFILRFIHYSVFNNHWVIWGLFLLLAGVSIRANAKKSGWKKFHSLSLTWFILPFLIGFSYSVWKAPVLQYSTLIFSYPFFLIFIFSFINEKWISQKVIGILVIIVLFTGVYSTVVAKKYYKTNHFGVFKELAEKTKQWDEKYGRENVVKFFSLSNPEYINYYFRKLYYEPAISVYTDDERSKFASLIAMLDTSTAKYFVYAWTNAVHAYETPALIMEKFPAVVERDTFFNSEITLFGKGPVSSQERTIAESDFESKTWNIEPEKLDTTIRRSGHHSQKIDENTEYSFGFTAATDTLRLDATEILKAEAWFYAPDSIKDALLVISFLKNNELLTYSSAPLLNYYHENNSWTRILLFSEMPTEDCELRVYFWNPEKEIFFIDDLKIIASKRHHLFGP